MAIFYSDSGSLRDLKVTGSTFMSASTGIALQVKSSGSTIFSVSGSGGEIFNISDVGSSTALFTVASGSTNILNVDNTKAVSVSGSLVVTGSLNTNNALYVNASNVGIGTSSPTAKLHVSGTTLLSGSLTIDIPSKTNGYVLTSDASGNATWSPSVATLSGGTNNYMAVWTGSTQLTSSVIFQSGSKIGIGLSPADVPASTLQVNGSIIVGQSGSLMGQRIDFIRTGGGATMTGLSGATSGVIQVGGGNVNFVDIYAADAYIARFSETTAGPGFPALNLKGPLFISGSGYGGTVAYMTTITGSGVSGSLNVNNVMYVSSSYVTINTLLTLPTMSALPAAPPTGTLASSGSGANCKLYFFNGTWNTLF